MYITPAQKLNHIFANLILIGESPLPSNVHTYALLGFGFIYCLFKFLQSFVRGLMFAVTHFVRKQTLKKRAKVFPLAPMASTLISYAPCRL